MSAVDQVYALVRRSVVQYARSVKEDPNLTCSSLNKTELDGGIPLSLGVNVCVWVLLLSVFILIRYCATEYSRVGYITKKRWANAYYKSTSTNDGQNLLDSDNEDQHWYSWILKFFWKLTDRDISSRCGPDAMLYLLLQRYLLVLLVIFSAFSLLIILPINVTSDLGESGFARTTIANLDPANSSLWTHTLLALLYFLITVLFMIHYSLQLGKYQEQYSNYTVMLQLVPEVVHREDLLQHFQESLPESGVSDLQLAYDVSELVGLHKKLLAVEQKLEGVESVRVELGKEEVVRVGMGVLLFWKKEYQVDAKAYYTEKKQELIADINIAEPEVRNKRLGVAFVTFSNEAHALSFCDQYKMCRRKPVSSMSTAVKSRWWLVSMAPFPNDIVWENLSVSYFTWWVRWLVINIPLFVFLFFLTTPAIMLASIDELRHRLNVTTGTYEVSTPRFVTLYLPNLLLYAFAVVMPFFVAWSSHLEAHWTKSFKEQTIMRKLYMYLVLMVLILPSIGLTSLDIVAQMLINNAEAIKNQLRCIFLPGNGAFFVSYVLTLTFVGTGVELLRVPELAEYVYRRLTSKTYTQKEQALKKAARYDFLYGIQYAWNLVVFTVVMSYSIICPIIVPVGVLYFTFKYYTDKYNIYYVYQPASFHGRQFLHRSAVAFVLVGALHLQVTIIFFSLVRSGASFRDPHLIFLLFFFVLICVGYLCAKVFGCFSHLLPSLRLKMGKEHRVFKLNGENVEHETIEKRAYIPSVLKGLPSSDVTNSVHGYQSFGSADNMGRYSCSTTSSSASSTPHASGLSTPTSMHSMAMGGDSESGMAVGGPGGSNTSSVAMGMGGSDISGGAGRSSSSSPVHITQQLYIHQPLGRGPTPLTILTPIPSVDERHLN